MLRNVKIRHQLTLLIVVVGSLTLLLTIVYLLLLAQIRSLSEQANTLNRAALSAGELAIATQYTASDISSYYLGHLDHREEFNEHLARFDTALDTLVTFQDVLTDRERSDLEEISSLRGDYVQAAISLFDATDTFYTADSQDERLAAQTQQAVSWDDQNFLADQLDAIFSDMAYRLETGAAAADDNLRQSVQAGNILSLVLPIPVIALSLLVMLTVRGAIARPLASLTRATTGFATGDYSLRAAKEGENEFGELSDAFNNMAHTIQEREGQLKELNLSLEEEAQIANAARAQAERSDQVKSAFLASMSHELRTPLNAVINFTKFVAQGDFGPVNAEQKSTLFEVVDSARHLLNLINDVLDMSKIESGSLNLFVQDGINVTEILNGVVTTGNSLIQDKPVEIRTDVAADLPTIRGDKQRIRQIFLNIMSNACKFTQEGYIEIRASHKNGEIVVSMTDTGYGIAPEDQPAVFEAFRQTSAGLRQGGGTGLGMPISKNLVEIHGGRLWLESEVGKGSTFHVALPIQSEELVPLNLGV